MITPAQIKMLVIVGGLIASGFLGYKFGKDSVLSDWKTETAKMNAATSDAMIKLQKQRGELEKELMISESEAWEKYSEAESEASRLSRELNNRPWRVRVVTEANCSVPEASAASSVDDAGEAARELPDKTKRRIERIARDANQCEAQLSALQEYVRGVLKLN